MKLFNINNLVFAVNQDESGKEVIGALQKLGGINYYNFSGSDKTGCYYLNSKKQIEFAPGCYDYQQLQKYLTDENI